MVTIPFSFLPMRVLRFFSDYAMKPASALQGMFPYLQLELDRANIELEANRYIALCSVSVMFLFAFLAITLTIIFSKIGSYLLGTILALVCSAVILFLQMRYPTIVVHRRIRRLDADLLTALRTIMIQLNSGVPLFETMAIISRQKFGEVSIEFQKAVKKINAGVPQTEALESMALKNPSPYFRRAIWQIINGMKSGAAINKVIDDIIDNLTREQVIQIEKYGSQLNPLAMFYMMFAVIMPALGITMLIVLASFIEFEELLIKLLFWGLWGIVILFQIIFLGLIKIKRPTLLGE